MYYTKEERYSFIVPKEYKAYLSFKEKLQDSNILFKEEGGSINQAITVTTRGRFTVDDDGNIVDKEN